MFRKKGLYAVMALLIALTLMFTLAGCGGSDQPANEPAHESAENSQPAEDQVSEAAEIMNATAAYLDSKQGPTIGAQEVYENAVQGGDDSYFILSIQKPEDFAKGHVKGAINIPYGQVAKKENLAKLPKDKKIVVICYTGHTASYTSMFLNQLGYEAYAMKMGMNGWNAESAGMGAVKPYAGSAGFDVSTETVEAQPVNEIPEVNTGAETAEDIIIAATDAYLSAGRGPTISPQEINEKFINGGDDSYFLLSIQKPEDYAKGHVPGAINIPYGAIAQEENLKKLPKDKKIVVICYTGHTASYTSMFLNQLGYESYTLKFGTMGWNDKTKGMGAVKAFSQSPGYETVEGEI